MKFQEAVQKAKDMDCEHAVPALKDWHRSGEDATGCVACLEKARQGEDDIECHGYEHPTCPLFAVLGIVVLVISILIAALVYIT